MKKVTKSFLILALLLGGLFNLQSQEIPFKIKNGVPYIVATINGKGLKLMIDTGASVSVINKRTADHLGIVYDKQYTSVTGVGGSKKIHEAYRIQIVTKSATIDHSSMMVTDLGSVKTKSGCAGIIGTDFFRKGWVIDYGRKVIYKPEKQVRLYKFDLYHKYKKNPFYFPKKKRKV